MKLIKQGGTGAVEFPPHAWETKEGFLLYSPESVSEYNAEFHNYLGVEDELYTRSQVLSMMRAMGMQVGMPNEQ